jgi:sialic acid synthase SpsE
MKTPFVIAEAGACHEGQYARALDLIIAAHEAGCQAIKFQLYDADRLSARRHAELFRETYRRYQLPHRWLPDLQYHANVHGLELILSVYDHYDLEAAICYADWLKIASFESQDHALLDTCRLTGKPLLISLGLATEIDILRARFFRWSGVSGIFLLHCISAYPAPFYELNLSVIRRHRLDGFSDHTGHVLTGALAVAYGATILEVHLKLEDTPVENPDFPHALIPADLSTYVEYARLAAQVTGGRARTIQESERVNTAYKVRT